jgi:hypothetical protein
MHLNVIRKGLFVASAICLALLWARLSYGQELVSFQSSNYPTYYIRHRNSLFRIDKIRANDKLGRNDATFRRVAGLAGRCDSFESMNYPGHFLRHQNFRLKLAKRTDDQLFKDDSTFCLVRGLYGSGGHSFESVNLPRHYVRHRNFELWLDRPDGSTLFRRDATFTKSPDLINNSPAVIIDEGTRLNPVPPEP